MRAAPAATENAEIGSLQYVHGIALSDWPRQTLEFASFEKLQLMIDFCNQHHFPGVRIDSNLVAYLWLLSIFEDPCSQTVPVIENSAMSNAVHGERKSDSEHLPTAVLPNSRLCTAQGRPTSSPGAASCRTAHGCTTEGTGCHRGVAQHDCRSLQLSVTVIRIFGSKYGKRIHCKRIRPPALMVSEKLSSRTWTPFKVRALLDTPEQRQPIPGRAPCFARRQVSKSLSGSY